MLGFMEFFTDRISDLLWWWAGTVIFLKWMGDRDAHSMVDWMLDRSKKVDWRYVRGFGTHSFCYPIARMTVYVDEIRTYPNTPWRGGKASHMWADTLDELHEMAERVGLLRAWFQNRPGFPHYDMAPSKRELALGAGAVFKPLVQHIKERRNAQVSETPRSD